VPVVLTTAAGARRLGGNAAGLAPYASATVGAVELTATPSRHGPAWSRPIVGPTTGFALRPPGAEDVVWISGDTVAYPGVRRLADRFTIDTAILHLGRVQFGLTGPTRFTMAARDAATLCTRLNPRRIVPVHYEGWSHFHEAAPRSLPLSPPTALTWLTRGTPTTLP